MKVTHAVATASTRILLSAVLLGSLPAAAQSSGKVVLAVSEGTSGGATPPQIVDKYRPLADTLGKALKAQVVVNPVRSFQQLEEGMRARRFDLVMARPSDYPARGIRDSGYRYVASAQPDGQCVFLVPKASPAKSLADLKGKTVALPEKVSYMAHLCRAELRDAGFEVDAGIQNVKEQETVVYQVKTNAVPAGGVASYSKALKAKDEAGLRELARSRPQPYFPLVASPSVTPEQVAAMRKELVSLQASPAGQKILAGMGITGYDGDADKRLADMLAWLEKK
jgi:ABC-type phosphate/phosphonate transport system substrate-binding protein